MTNYTLRSYQKEAVDAGVAYLTDPALKGRHGLIVAPTGAGKSLVIANIVARLPDPCVVLQPSKEILEQNAAKLASYSHHAAVFSASFGRREIGRITLATIGSVVRYAEAFREIPYVLIDEVHQAVNPKGGQYLEFLSVLEGARLMGLTATPFRLHSNSLGSELRFLTRTRPRIFRDVVHVTQIQDLVRDGYWCQLEYRTLRVVDRTKLALNSTGADYTDSSVQRHFAEVGFVGKLYDTVRALLTEGRKHILVFTRFVAEAERLAQALPCVGVVTAETPAGVRADLIRAFRSGQIRVVANVGVLGIGFDFPALDTVVLGRPSVSLATYYQQLGRAVRPHPSKTQAAIVDLVGLSDLFGKVEDLVVRPTGPKGEQWVVSSNGRALTNTYFAQRDGIDPATVAKGQQRRQYWARRKGGGMRW
jgi:DNA repair protein RadD